MTRGRMLSRARSRRRLAAAALVVVAVATMFVALRHVGWESSAPGPEAGAHELLQRADLAARAPQDAGIQTLVARLRVAIYYLGDQRTGTPWISVETATWYEAPDRKRVEIEFEFAPGARAPDGSAAVGYSQTGVWDGANHWTRDAGDGAITVRREEQRGSAFGFGDLLGVAPSTVAEADPLQSTRCTSVAVSGEGTVAGRDAWIVEFGRPRCGLSLPGEDGRRVVWIDKATNLALRSESYAADGQLYASGEITHLEVNGTIDPDRFRFVAPGDAILHDLRGTAAPAALIKPTVPPVPISLAEATAEATFDVLAPATVPDGFELESVEHYWSNEDARMVRSHADWLRLRYTNAAGDWVVIEQGFGGPLVLFATAAPDNAPQGVVRINGASARWIDGNPTTGWEPGVMMLLYIDGGRRGAGWAIGPDGGTVIGSPFHVVLASNALTMADLVAVAESVQ